MAGFRAPKENPPKGTAVGMVSQAISASCLRTVLFRSTAARIERVVFPKQRRGPSGELCRELTVFDTLRVASIERPVFL